MMLLLSDLQRQIDKRSFHVVFKYWQYSAKYRNYSQQSSKTVCRYMKLEWREVHTDRLCGRHTTWDYLLFSACDSNSKEKLKILPNRYSSIVMMVLHLWAPKSFIYRYHLTRISSNSKENGWSPAGISLEERILYKLK